MVTNTLIMGLWQCTATELCKFQDQKLMLCWCSVDTLLTLCWRSVDALLTLCWRSGHALLTLCWRSADPHFEVIVLSLSQGIWLRMAADSSILDWCGRSDHWFSQKEGLKSLRLHWHSFLGWGNQCVAYQFSYNPGQFICFGRMWQCNPMIAKCVWLKVIDTPLTLTSNTSRQSLYIHSLYATNRTGIIDSQYSVSLY